MYFDYKPVISINFCSFVSTSQKKKNVLMVLSLCLSSND